MDSIRDMTGARRCGRGILGWVCIVILVLIGGASWAARSVSAQALEDDEFGLGLIGLYRGGDGRTFERVDPRIAFAWDGDRRERRLDEGPFRVRWTGYLMSQASGEYRLRAYFSGNLRIRLGDRTIIEGELAEPGWRSSPALPLEFDYHPLAIEYSSGAVPPQVALFWSGPQFGLEPITERYLYHDPARTPPDTFERGAALTRALRCAACHAIRDEPAALAAPALDRLADNIQPAWLIECLHDDAPRGHAAQPGDSAQPRRMPRFGLSRDDATAIAAFLFASSTSDAAEEPAEASASPEPNRKSRDGKLPQDPVDPARGRQLLLTLGCLACHQHEGLGANGLFGGGDLSKVSGKRPADFFARWLAAPERINRDCRMPVYALSDGERGSLAAFLAQPRDAVTDDAATGDAATGDATTDDSVAARALAADVQLVQRGRSLVERHGCAGCHRLPDGVERKESRIPLAIAADAITTDTGTTPSDDCLASPAPDKNRPGYELNADDRQAVARFLAAVGAPADRTAGPAMSGEHLLAELNCLACHARGTTPGLADTAAQVAANHGELADLVPGMTPPSLNSVGDKLNDQALADAIARREEVRRDYLQVRMPKFRLTDEQLTALAQHFVAVDRIPPREDASDEPQRDKQLDATSLAAIGSRLVTTDGFGCTSCHAVADVEPVKAPLNARGPNLAQLGRRIRRPWFDRFVDNPARIVPRMEMPSVRLAVGGVLDNDLHRQLDAVWDVLNTPGFRPPLPDPVRVVRRAGIADRQESAVVVTDVVRAGERTYVKPLLIGLPNRHNVLVDLATARLAGWSIGDVARQRTEGKTWFWEAAGITRFESAIDDADIELLHAGESFAPRLQGQFVTEFDSLDHDQGGLVVRYRLRFELDDRPVVLQVEQAFRPRGFPGESAETGFRREVVVRGVPAGDAVRLKLAASDQVVGLAERDGRRALLLDGECRITLVEQTSAGVDETTGGLRADGSVTADVAEGTVRSVLDYETTTAVDQFPQVVPELPPPPVVPLRVVPGFAAVRLPLSDEIMPTALAWRPSGDLVVGSLKGRVWIGRDTDGDGLEDQLRPFSDELAAPYGLAAGDGFVDVLNKYALLRLEDRDADGLADHYATVASGWGHTADYHDWAVGLPSDGEGGYYMALPCQQDKRSLAAAAHRGEVMRLVPRAPDDDDPRAFRIERISAGHRFPMGVARNRAGDVFVTDNQGHYNPFNELNHVMRGRRYGFINAVERRADFQPPLTPPAIDIPHPWTRSVNGICFLETPAALRSTLGASRFGPFEGHLIGCEYDTRRLIRMSLQKVGDTYQGAAYPFSMEDPPEGPPLLGPLVCEVAPDGDLYVGGIRDSGWGGANNVGELVRLEPHFAELPCGIAEVRAVADGFEVRLTRSADAARLADPANYAISSYTRVSTPAYGGEDRQRRVERIRAIEPHADGTRVELKLNELRPGFVYELRLKNLAQGDAAFFPAEAYYTLRAIP